jgi:hypothetical protein
MTKTKSKTSAASAQKKLHNTPENLQEVKLVFTATGKQEKTHFNVHALRVTEPYVAVTPLPLPSLLLLSVQHSHLQTCLDLSQLSNTYVIGFDDKLQFIGVSIVGKKSQAPFQLLNQAKHFLLAPKSTNINFSQLKKIILPR